LCLLPPLLPLCRIFLADPCCLNLLFVLARIATTRTQRNLPPLTMDGSSRPAGEQHLGVSATAMVPTWAEERRCLAAGALAVNLLLRANGGSRSPGACVVPYRRSKPRRPLGRALPLGTGNGTTGSPGGLARQLLNSGRSSEWRTTIPLYGAARALDMDAGAYRPGFCLWERTITSPRSGPRSRACRRLPRTTSGTPVATPTNLSRKKRWTST
jgi:hypothetical protein